MHSGQAPLGGGSSTMTLVGMARQTKFGIITEQVGSVVVGAATIYYATATVVVSETFPPATGIVLAWGLSCFWRWGQLQSLINKLVIEQAALKVIGDIE